MATAREALQTFAQQLRRDFYTWYDKSATRCYRWYLALQLGIFVSSSGTAILAALSNGKNFEAWAKYVIVFLPLTGACAAAILAQLRIHDLWRLREQGRLQIQTILLEADRRVASAADEQECSAIHAELEARVNGVEMAQSTTFFDLYRQDLVLHFSPPTPQQHESEKS